MGITTTQQLDLIKPDRLEPIGNWPFQNLINCMLLDNKVKVTSHTYTPVLTATVTNPTIAPGGSLIGKYLRFSNNWILTYGQYQFDPAGGNSRGDGEYLMSLPVLADSAIYESAALDTVGSFVWRDIDAAVTNQRLGSVDLSPPDLQTVRFIYGVGSGDTIAHDQPVLQFAGDSLSFYCFYKEAPII